MRARSQHSELPETKRKIVDAGIKLMRLRGYHATSVDEICEEATVTKGAFFHYFESKEDLAKAAVVRFRESSAQILKDAPFRKVVDPLERVFARMEYVRTYYGVGGQVTKGCLIGTFAQELSFTNPEMRSVCQASFELLTADFEKDLAAAKAAYAPAASFDPRTVASMYVSMVQGSMMLAKAAEANTVLKENIDQFRHYLEILFGSNARPSVARATRN